MVNFYNYFITCNESASINDVIGKLFFPFYHFQLTLPHPYGSYIGMRNFSKKNLNTFSTFSVVLLLLLLTSFVGGKKI